MCHPRNVAMRDYQERVTTGQTDTQMDGWTERHRTKWSLWAAMLCRRHKNCQLWLPVDRFTVSKINIATLAYLMTGLRRRLSTCRSLSCCRSQLLHSLQKKSCEIRFRKPNSYKNGWENHEVKGKWARLQRISVHGDSDIWPSVKVQGHSLVPLERFCQLYVQMANFIPMLYLLQML